MISGSSGLLVEAHDIAGILLGKEPDDFAFLYAHNFVSPDIYFFNV